MANQNPEQKARDAIDAQLRASGWVIQDKHRINFHAGVGQAVREYTTDSGPADYVLFIDSNPVGVIEAKKETLGQSITSVESQTEEYAAASLKWVQKTGGPLPFLYEATGVLTRFTDQRDPKPRSREVFAFHRPETLRELLAQEKSLRRRLLDNLPSLDPTGLRDCQVNAITKLDDSFRKAKPRALVQMATGSGKTFTADIYRIKTEVSEKGVTVKAGHDYQKRDRLTRAKRWEIQEAEETYQKTQLDRSVVVPDQLRTVIRTFREKLFTEIFTDRPARAKAMGLDEPWVPKTLIFAKCE